MVYHTIIIHYYYMLVHTVYCVNVLVFIKVLKKGTKPEPEPERIRK